MVLEDEIALVRWCCWCVGFGGRFGFAGRMEFLLGEAMVGGEGELLERLRTTIVGRVRPGDWFRSWRRFVSNAF